MSTASPPIDEAAAVDAVVASLHQQMVHDYPSGLMRRDAHPKVHGCVQAELIVSSSLPSDFQEGVFAEPGRRYRAWIRFSNCFQIRPDLKEDTRGMAVKLLGVSGYALPGAEGGTQDFLAGTHDAFFIPDAMTYAGFPAAAARGDVATAIFFLRHRLWRGIANARKSTGTLAMNPLAISYFSQTAFRLGPHRVVKFQFRPVLTRTLGESLPWAPWFKVRSLLASTIMRIGDLVGATAAAEAITRVLGAPDLLRQAMAASLEKSDAWFELLVQRREGSLSVEDATAQWHPEQAPFHRVAWIRIPRQVFTADHLPDATLKDAAIAMEEVGEHLSFNPWNGLAAHEPLGSINRARKRVNAESSIFRHRKNGVPRVAPDAADFDRLATRVRLAPGSVDPRPDPQPVTRRSRWALLYLRRVPLLSALFAILFPVASVWERSPLSTYTLGIFDVHGPALAIVSLLTCILAFTIMSSWWVITAHADRRYGTLPAYAVYPTRRRWYGVSLLLIAAPLALATLVAAGADEWQRQDWAIWVGGWAVGLLAALCIMWTARWAADFIGDLPPIKVLAQWLSKFPTLGAGYVDANDGKFLPGHLLALGLAGVSAAIYITIGSSTIDRPLPQFPALVFLLLLPILACSALSFTTFFFDRFKVPALTLLLVTAVALHDLRGASYSFELLAETRSPLSPHQVLAAPRPSAGTVNDAVIVVAAGGGGTQSAVWTTRVLTGLVEACRGRCSAAESVALISATSGGALGAMHFAEAYEGGRLARSAESIEALAAASTEDAVWRALAYGDLFRPLRALRAGPTYRDRALALEHAWQRSTSDGVTIEAYRDDARAGIRPGLILNSTIAATGEPLLISTAGRVPGPHDFLDMYRGHNIPVSRAVRLSATFPIVVPFARDGSGLQQSPLVDGGYSDLFAVDAATAWLRDALAKDLELDGRIKRVLLLQIRAPEWKGASPLLTNRAADQLERNRRGVESLRLSLQGKIDLSTVVFQLCDRASVAWHVTAKQRAKIHEQWRDEQQLGRVAQILEFLGAPRPIDDEIGIPSEPSCYPRAAPIGQVDPVHPAKLAQR